MPATDAPAPDAPAPGAVPHPVRRAGRLLLAEGVVVGVGAVVYGVQGLQRAGDSLAGGEGAAVLLLLWGVALGFLGRGVLRGRPWARTPALVLQLLTLAVAYAVGQSGATLAALAVAVPPVLVLALLLGPSARATFVR